MFVNVYSTELFKIGHQFIWKKKKFKQKMDLKVQIEKGYKSPNRKEKQNSYSLDKGNKNPYKKEIEKSNGQWI